MIASVNPNKENEDSNANMATTAPRGASNQSFAAASSALIEIRFQVRIVKRHWLNLLYR